MVYMLNRASLFSVLSLALFSMLLAPAKQTYVLLRQVIDKEYYERLSSQVIDEHIIASLEEMPSRHVRVLQICSRTYYSPSVFLLSELRNSLPGSIKVYFPNHAICRLPVREGSNIARVYFGGEYPIELLIDGIKAAGAK